jgi:hypothetical protein
MEPEVSLLCSQEPATGPYPEPDESRPDTSIPLYKVTVDTWNVTLKEKLNFSIYLNKIPFLLSKIR